MMLMSPELKMGAGNYEQTHLVEIQSLVKTFIKWSDLNLHYRKREAKNALILVWCNPLW